MFSAKYEDARNKLKFLKVFHRRISRPVLPSDEELAYLPTQAVAAYVTNVLGLDGIIYSSTQVGAEGESTGEQLPRALCNVVLFGSAAVVERTPGPPRPTESLERADPFGPSLPPVALEVALPDAGPAPSLDDQVAAAVQREATPFADPQEARGEPAQATDPLSPEPDGLAEDGSTASLRVKRDPRLVRIRAVKVDPSGVFAHLYDDGRIIIGEDDDDFDE